MNQRLIIILIKFFLIHFLLSDPTASYASTSEENIKYFENETNYENLPGYFRNSYLGVGISKNFPMNKTQENFAPGKYSLLLRYSHLHKQTWVMGVSANFKSIEKIDQNKNFSLLSISHFGKYLIRLYHPLYFSIGNELIYLLPAIHDRFPIQRDKDYELEIGVGLIGTISIITTKYSALNFSASRWRGTKTTKFQGAEYTLTLDYGLN